MLVIDANVAVAACAEENGFNELGDELAAPPLMWSEARANLHLELFKQAIPAEDAAIMHKRLEECPVQRQDPPELGRRAWELAERFGWGRTYDAEYVALAQILSCRLVTLDARLRRGAAQLGIVIGVHELTQPKVETTESESGDD
ncbi:MAG TPA: type II toxin-antitoxin system VapC family toxin [Solirubrobacteraceae bacterium]|jgi:predicted nucleic acid-binding protein|nr:type II toxin-antitoxin system VapC family toxin [Solirubrobacteraceae bacterium]